MIMTSATSYLYILVMVFNVNNINYEIKTEVFDSPDKCFTQQQVNMENSSAEDSYCQVIKANDFTTKK